MLHLRGRVRSCFDINNLLLKISGLDQFAIGHFDNLPLKNFFIINLGQGVSIARWRGL